MNRPTQFRCPYTLKRLDEVRRLSNEHIFHEAIGGPQSYSFKTDQEENSTLGHTTDARFANSKFVELWRATYGIAGRLDREPRSRLTKQVAESDQQVDVKIRQGPPSVHYTPPVEIDWEKMTGRLTGQAIKLSRI